MFTSESRRTSLVATLQALAVSVALLFCLSTHPRAALAQGAGYFDAPEVMQGLPLDKAGSNGWAGQVKSMSPLGAIAYPGEIVTFDLLLSNSDKDVLKVAPTIEVCRFATRMTDMNDWFKPGYVNEFVGKPARTTVPAVEIAPGKNVVVSWASKANEFTDFGAYAVIVDIPGKGRQGVATFVRIHPPNPLVGDGRGSPIIVSWFGDTGEFPYMARIGYKWVRTDGFPNWNGVATRNHLGGPDGPFDWTRSDATMDGFRQNKLWVLSNMYGGPDDATTAANRKAFNMVPLPMYDDTWGLFVQEAVRRYCGPDGSGPLQIIDYYNEPWDGGGISGWKSDTPRYRTIYKIIYDHAKKASSHILVGGTSSIMNTCDKLLTLKNWQKSFGIDVSTDHYVQPHMMQGPRIAATFGAASMDTETWCGKLDEQQMALAAHFLACGQTKVTPQHFPSQLPWTNGPGGPMFGCLAAASNEFLDITAGRTFTRACFLTHLPWLYQWGEGKTATYILSGDHTRLNNGRPQLYSQIVADGTITIDSLGGKLKAYDLYGNLYPTKAGKYTLPCGFRNVYMEAPGLDPQKLIDAVDQGRMEGIKPVEMFLDDFIVPAGQVRTVDVEVHNVLNRAISGTLTLTPPDGVKLGGAAIPVTLQPGESKKLQFPVQILQPDPANAYPMKLSFEGPDGKAEVSDALHVNTITYGHPTVDGTLDTWKDAAPVINYGKDEKGNFVETAWKPWEKQTDLSKGVSETRFMWDENFLYIAVRERNKDWAPKPRLSTRDDNSYFGKDDMAQTYIRGNEDALPFTGNCVQVGIGLGLHEHPLAPYNKVPAKMIASDDTDYEYAFWGAPDGGAEIWRSNTPTMMPCNFLPRSMPDGYDGVPKGTKSAIKRDGIDTIYEVAIPLSDMPELKPDAGKVINIAYCLPGSLIQAGAGRSRTRFNGLTLHATWNWDKCSNDLRWGFVK